jgi:hypothetical protein
MPHFLVSGHLPDNFDPSAQSEETVHNINQLNDELEAAGARLVAAGLSAPSQAKTLRAQPNGEVLITDGPYLEAKEHVGGFTILEAADMDEALSWARKSVIAFRTPVEVREIPYSNLPHGTAHPSRQRKP